MLTVQRANGKIAVAFCTNVRGIDFEKKISCPDQRSRKVFNMPRLVLHDRQWFPGGHQFKTSPLSRSLALPGTTTVGERSAPQNVTLKDTLRVSNATLEGWIHCLLYCDLHDFYLAARRQYGHILSCQHRHRTWSSVKLWSPSMVK